MTYTLEHGSYYQRSEHGNHIEKMCDQVTLAYSKKAEEDGGVGYVIHRHGAFENVRTWWVANRESAEGLFGPIFLVTFPPKFDVDEINAFIEFPHRLAKLEEAEYMDALGESD